MIGPHQASGSSVQDAQHLVNRFTKRRYNVRIGKVSEPITGTECSTGSYRTLSESLTTRIAQLRRVKREWRKTNSERLGRKRAHRLLDE